MQLVIEISDTLKQIADEEDVKTFSHLMWRAILMDAIKNGKQIDLDGLKKDMASLKCGYPYGLDYLLKCIENRLGIRLGDCE